MAVIYISYMLKRITTALPKINETVLCNHQMKPRKNSKRLIATENGLYDEVIGIVLGVYVHGVLEYLIICKSY